jgi:ectoine hydroxylase-related dioxygenase (phytanoyl-CoA dioxygenase family)
MAAESEIDNSTSAILINRRSTIDHAKQKLKDDGWCVIPDVLSPEKTAHVLQRLWAAAEESERREKGSTHKAGLDPNSANVRVLSLMDIDPLFIELISHPTAIEIVESLLGTSFLVSNFTANIARPGSRSMGLHSDLSLQCPDPWHHPWNLNIIWALTDVYYSNGATLFIPGSQRWVHYADVPADAETRLVPFEAKAGSIIAMDGRIWHTSGANVTEAQDRALMFGAYNAGHLRGQMNWAAGLRDEVKAALTDQQREWLGVGPQGNIGKVTGVNRVCKTKL